MDILVLQKIATQDWYYELTEVGMDKIIEFVCDHANKDILEIMDSDKEEDLAEMLFYWWDKAFDILNSDTPVSDAKISIPAYATKDGVIHSLYLEPEYYYVVKKEQLFANIH